MISSRIPSCALLACASLSLGAPRAASADVELDAGWGASGRTIVPFDFTTNGADVAAGSALGSGGEMYIAGTVTDANGRRRIGLTKLRADGLVDEAGFGTLGRATSPDDFGESEGGAGVVLRGDVLYVGGTRQLGEAGSDFALCAFTLGGVPKPFEHTGTPCLSVSFDEKESISYDVATAIAVQPDGHVVLAGSSATDGDLQSTDAAFARFEPSGALDSKFAPDESGKLRLRSPGFDRHEIESIAVAANGKLVAVGATRRSGQIQYDALVVRLDPKGNADTNGFAQECAFAATQPGLATKLRGLVLREAQQGDDRIVAVGAAQYDMLGRYAALITEVSPDGCSLKDTFAEGGYLLMQADSGQLYFNAVAHDAGAGYVVAGDFETMMGGAEVFAAHYYGTDWLQFPTMHFGQSSKDWLVDVHVHAGSIYIAGWTQGAGSNRDFAAAKFGLDRIFADGFGDPVGDP
jgi:uncharacterized delta-60 repeat protein